MKVLQCGFPPSCEGLFMIRDDDRYSSTFPFFFSDFEDMAVLSLFVPFFFPAGFMKYSSESLWFFFLILSVLFYFKWFFSMLTLFLLWDLLLSRLFSLNFNYFSFVFLLILFFGGIKNLSFSSLTFLLIDDLRRPSPKLVFLTNVGPKISLTASLYVGLWGLKAEILDFLCSGFPLECFFFLFSWYEGDRWLCYRDFSELKFWVCNLW